MHAIKTSIACNPQPASLVPTMDTLLRAVASGEYGSDTRTDFLQAGLKHEKLMFVTSPFLDQNFSSSTRHEWQAQHSPLLLRPNSSDSMLRTQYPVLSLPAMHSHEANEGSSEETEEDVEGDRCEEGEEIANFYWVTVRSCNVRCSRGRADLTGVTTDAIPVDGPGPVISVEGPEEVQGLIPRRQSLLKV